MYIYIYVYVLFNIHIIIFVYIGVHLYLYRYIFIFMFIHPLVYILAVCDISCKRKPQRLCHGDFFGYDGGSSHRSTNGKSPIPEVPDVKVGPYLKKKKNSCKFGLFTYL